MREPPIEAYEPYAERVMRSVAHNIGNVVNVLSGRLSLLELQEGMGPEALEMIALMRERLRRAQTELREAVKFVSETTSIPNGRGAEDCQVARCLIVALGEAVQQVEGWQVLQDEEVAQRFVSSRPLVMPMTLLVAGVGRLLGEHGVPKWRCEVTGEGLLCELAVSETFLPSDRRAVLEPWFDSAAINGPIELRRGRLELATALGRIEEGGAHVSVARAANVSLVRIVWARR